MSGAFQKKKPTRTSVLRTHLEGLKTQRRTALMPYLTIGWPDPNSFLEIAMEVARNGADVLELGMPFSDPVADGSVIQQTSQQALDAGITFSKGLELATKVMEWVQIPVVLMTYYNPILRGGLVTRCQQLSEAGFKGLIVPDLPPEEGLTLETAAARFDLDLVYLCSPTSSRNRLQLITLHSRGFLYLVSRAGVTGEQKDLNDGLAKFISEVRRYTVLPVCVGFGISTAEQAREVGRLADGCIIGSALLNVIARSPKENRVSAARDFMVEIRSALDELSKEKLSQK